MSSSPASSAWSTAVSTLQLASRLVDGIQEGVRARGFDDVRPSHGFAFVRIAQGGATTADVGVHLGITKQAAAQLVARLEDGGYVIRGPHPTDRRSQVLALTARGTACTRAAEDAATAVVTCWREALRADERDAFERTLARLATGAGPLRPAW